MRNLKANSGPRSWRPTTSNTVGFYFWTTMLISELTLYYFNVIHSLKSASRVPSTVSLFKGPVKDWAKKVVSKSQLKPSASPSARSARQRYVVASEITWLKDANRHLQWKGIIRRNIRWWASNSSWPWTIPDEDLSNALHEIHSALHTNHRAIEFDVDFDLVSYHSILLRLLTLLCWQVGQRIHE
jgi:hypothetical protein